MDSGILGLDNVRLELPLAGIGSRSLAASIDYVLVAFLGGILVVGVTVVGAWADAGGGWLVALGALALFLVGWGYFAACEIAMDGRTPGKAAVGLRVVSATGGRASAAAILVRNVLRSVDHLIGIPWMALDHRSRRVGDVVAGTLVVHDRPERDEVRLGRLPAGWGPREVAVAEAFLRRAPWLEAERAGELAGRLLQAVARRDPDLVAEAAAAGGDPVAVLSRALAAGGA